MPTFQQALDADPAKFASSGAELMTTAGSVTGLSAKYGQEVAGLADAWQGDDYNGLVRWAGQVAVFNTQVELVLMTAAATLQAMGLSMAATVQALKFTKQTAEAVGFKVLPTPFVILGPTQWQQVSAAGPGAPAVLAAYQAGAVAYTTALMSQYAAIIAQDVACSTAVRAAVAL
jgi:hypothetical protein